MVAGTIIGASIFVQPSEIARHLETPGQILIVWAACGVLTLAGAIVCAELASVFPQTGGVYVFLRDIFSPLAGFLWGWAMFWSMHSGIIAAIAMVFARYAAFFVPAGDRGVRAIAVTVILLLSVLNYVGVRLGSRVQTILTGAKVTAIGTSGRSGSAVRAPLRRHAFGQSRELALGRRVPARVPAGHGRGIVRLWRLAHGDLHGW